MSKLSTDDLMARRGHRMDSGVPKRRCVSANAVLKAQRRFTSPDRYLPQRPGASYIASFRTTKPPTSLHRTELYFRQRDVQTNPFRVSNEPGSPNTTGSGPQTPQRLAGALHYTPSFVHASDAVRGRDSSTPPPTTFRQISVGGIWNVGGPAIVQGGQIHAIPNGRGAVFASGTNASLHATNFLEQHNPDPQLLGHERRLALALGLDQAVRTLPITPPITPAASRALPRAPSLPPREDVWTQSIRDGSSPVQKKGPLQKSVPSLPFRVLDAPNMKDDYYCSILAYCRTCRTLAVALTSKVYLWTERSGVHYPPFAPARPANFVTCLSFSSHIGRRAILGISRHSGRVSLWSLYESEVRFEIPHVNPASCLAFKPTVTRRQSASTSATVSCEDLLVADDAGQIFYYSVEWPDQDSEETGTTTLLARIQAHTQNICGLAWSPNGETFATGGNDNSAMLFEVPTVLATGDSRQRGRPQPRRASKRKRDRSPLRNVNEPDITSDLSVSAAPVHMPLSPDSPGQGVIVDIPLGDGSSRSPISVRPRPTSPVTHGSRNTSHGISNLPTPPTSPSRYQGHMPLLMPNHFPLVNLHKHSFYHSAAVKALSFAPWQPTLLATGGGSNDRQIHFHHTGSGATLAVINVFAQVTSLTWSKTRREIAATFGYAQPEHEVRIAVFAWPSCECVVSIPWERKPGPLGSGSEQVGRALWAVAYPGGPNEGTVPAHAARRLRGERDDDPDTRFRMWDVSLVMGDDNGRQPPSRAAGATVSPEHGRGHDTNRSRIRSAGRCEGETWASRTEEEGSLIIACCNETVKFFEIWAGDSKGRKGRGGRGLGAVQGVLGGSKILEGELDLDLGVDGMQGQQTIR